MESSVRGAWWGRKLENGTWTGVIGQVSREVCFFHRFITTYSVIH